MLTQTESDCEVVIGKLSGRIINMLTQTESDYEIDIGKLSGRILYFPRKT